MLGYVFLQSKFLLLKRYVLVPKHLVNGGSFFLCKIIGGIFPLGGGSTIVIFCDGWLFEGGFFVKGRVWDGLKAGNSSVLIASEFSTFPSSFTEASAWYRMEAVTPFKRF